MFKALLIKALAKIIQLIGLVYRPQKKIENIKTILVNKADRIGDAIVALPLILELKKHFEITVLTTSRNDFVFKDFFKTEGVLEKPRYIYEEIVSILKALFLMFERTSKKDPVYDLYLDFNGIREIDFLIKLRKENRCRYYVGLNSGPFNVFLDYAHGSNSMLFSKKQILETFQEVIKNSLQLNIEIPDYIDLSIQMERPESIELKFPFVLINIAGSMNFRGPSVKFYAEIIKALSNKEINFLIIDELNQPNLRELRGYLGDNIKNIIYLNKNIDLWQLLYIASKSLLYIGADSGVTNFLNIPTNAMIFFATGLPWVWRPYSKNPYKERKIANIIIYETETSKGLIKKVIYRPIWCRPCFDLGCREKRCSGDFLSHKEIIVKEIEKIISHV